MQQKNAATEVLQSHRHYKFDNPQNVKTTERKMWKILSAMEVQHVTRESCLADEWGAVIVNSQWIVLLWVSPSSIGS